MSPALRTFAYPSSSHLDSASLCQCEIRLLRVDEQAGSCATDVPDSAPHCRVSLVSMSVKQFIVLISTSKLAGHALAILLIAIGLIGIAIHLAHRHVRRRVHLVTHPGTIGSVVALTSHSGFGELLYPFDDKRTIRRKLAHLRFSLDRRTGAIVADEIEPDAHHDDETDAEKVELSKISSRTPLVNDDGPSGSSRTLPEPAASMPHFPYEHEPLVFERSRSPSWSPGSITPPITLVARAI